MEYQIAAMTAAEVPQVAALEQELFSAPWDAASLLRELENPLSLWLVALKEGQVTGYVGSQSVLGESDMMNLAVAPAFRRQGIGRRLVQELLYELETDNHCLLLEVRQSNEAAIALYYSLGFRQVGRRPRYYKRPTEDALILRKDW